MRLRSRVPFLDLEVRNPVHRTSYRVFFPEYPERDSAFCGCTDFARRGLGTCKHVEAAWDWLRAQPSLPEVVEGSIGPPAADVWQEVDRRLEELGRSSPRVIREVERAGAPLFEPSQEPAAPKKGEAEEKVGRPRSSRPRSTSTSRARP